MIVIEYNDSEVQKALAGTSKSFASIRRKTLSIMARGTVKAINTGIRERLNRRTGELLKAFRFHVKKNGTANVYPDGESGGKIFPKTFALNFGYDGETKRAYNKPHSFIEIGRTYLESGAYMPDVEKMVSKELEKYWGK